MAPAAALNPPLTHPAPKNGRPPPNWLRAWPRARSTLTTDAGVPVFDAAFNALLTLVQPLQDVAIATVAHRVVHGGGLYTESVVVTDTVLEDLARFNSLAPLHQPHNLEGIRQFRTALPELPPIACIDTAFHASMPEVDYAFALPHSIQEQGVRRYGFHGLSYQYIMCAARTESAWPGPGDHGSPGQQRRLRAGNSANVQRASAYRRLQENVHLALPEKSRPPSFPEAAHHDRRFRRSINASALGRAAPSAVLSKIHQTRRFARSASTMRIATVSMNPSSYAE